MNGLRSDQEAPVGTPEVLPLTTTLLSPADIESALAIVHDNDELLGRLGDHRYEVVEAEVCDPKDGECSRLGIFDYDAGVCLHVFINRSSESVDDVIEGSCSPSNGEIEQARLIAESDPRVQEVFNVYDDERYIEWARAWVPRAEGTEEGHRYVAVRWNLDGDTVVAEFIVDLTTQTVCYEC